VLPQRPGIALRRAPLSSGRINFPSIHKTDRIPHTSQNGGNRPAVAQGETGTACGVGVARQTDAREVSGSGYRKLFGAPLW
jgi:hypothetical protein